MKQRYMIVGCRPKNGGEPPSHGHFSSDSPSGMRCFLLSEEPMSGQLLETSIGRLSDCIGNIQINHCCLCTIPSHSERWYWKILGDPFKHLRAQYQESPGCPWMLPARTNVAMPSRFSHWWIKQIQESLFSKKKVRRCFSRPLSIRKWLHNPCIDVDYLKNTKLQNLSPNISNRKW